MLRCEACVHSFVRTATQASETFARRIIADDVNDSLLKTHLKDVELVMVGGRALYGDSTAIATLRPADCEEISVSNVHQRVCVKDSRTGVVKSGQSLAEIQSILKARYADLAPLTMP